MYSFCTLLPNPIKQCTNVPIILVFSFDTIKQQCSCLFRKYNKQVCLSDGQPDRGLKHTMCTGPGQVVDPTRLRAGLSQLTLAWAPRPAPVQWWEEEGGLHEGWVVSTDEYLMGSCEGEGRYVFLEVCEFYCGFHE